MDQAARGAAALKEGKYTEAVAQYSTAINRSPGAVDYYIKRSTAYQRSSPPDYNAALQDAEIAVTLATQRAKRELIGQAQLRRGIALFGLGRYADAGRCFAIAKKYNEKESSLLIWEKKVEGKLRELDEGSGERGVTIADVPDVKLPSQGDKASGKKTSKAEETSQTTAAGTKGVVAADIVQTPANKIRHEWFQNADTVTIELFAKGVPEDKVKSIVELEHQSVTSPQVPVHAAADECPGLNFVSLSHRIRV